MTLTQLIKEIFDNSRERIKTPITGAFFTAFILWNWRPILQLMFSKMAMEHRIEIVDHDFINIWSWLVPLLLAIGYITVVPLFTNLIDGWMVKNKESRIDKIYESKSYDLDKKIKIASKELQLKNVETYNKEIEDFMIQINQLQEEKAQIQKEHKLKLDEANNRFDEIVNINQKLQQESSDYLSELAVTKDDLSVMKDDFKKERNDFYEVIHVIKRLNALEVLALVEMSPLKGKVPFIPNSETVEHFIDLKLATVTQADGVALTELGRKVIEKLTVIKTTI